MRRYFVMVPFVVLAGEILAMIPQERKERAEAFARVWHPRLGAESPARVLPWELISEIVRLAEAVPLPVTVRTWREVLQAMRDQALLEAAQRGNFDRVRILLAAGANPLVEDNGGYTPLHWAAFKGNLAIVEALLAVGANPNTDNLMGYTPLYDATEKGYFEIVQLLLEAGANPNFGGLFNQLLSVAMQENIRQLLLQYSQGRMIPKALYLTRQQQRRMSKRELNNRLLEAAESNNVENIGIFLAVGADPDCTPLMGEGQTPLHYAAFKNNLAIVKALLAAGANPNIQMIDGATPLHIAARMGHEAIVRELLAAGANPEIEDNESQSSIDIAANDKIRRILQEAARLSE